MTGKARIVYIWGGSDDDVYEAMLSWGEGDERESIFGRSRQSWMQAKERAIEKFKQIPPSEDIEVG